MQLLLVILIVAAAIGYTGWRLYKHLKQEQTSACGCGCAGCGLSQSGSCPGPDDRQSE
ncbi:MAG: FeoB-associated Cys-rich membrane protein [Desulfosarcinaceae bacterium]